MVDPKLVPLVREPYQPANELLRIKAKFDFSTRTQSSLASIALAFAMPHVPSWVPKKRKRQITPGSNIFLIIKILASTACSKKDFLHSIAELFNHGRVSQISSLQRSNPLPLLLSLQEQSELTYTSSAMLEQS
ncbi:hypothetical protein M9H77_13714 [Catharanthus roseus]|uniref:Uncharacterized protein n=1 Tax=Catharanthus roseus TaxID=4058 RepID=A0ACC0BL39_CATRO|nr:hypothetical protein M9H77_13714 [Catharanthus roseus]